jgi:2-polyprenyl-3-methyl-5-hydroxy-6-metoxy-1,4-benzoquinol methylase
VTILLDVELDDTQIQQLTTSDPRWWFTKFQFANAISPTHPKHDRLELANGWKRDMVIGAMRELIPGKSVLDMFCANGGFSYEAAQLGATRVLGVDYDETRLECARMISSFMNGQMPNKPEFRQADVYKLDESVTETFDVTLALGGLYHVADPALVLQNLRKVTNGHLIVQTSRLLRMPGSWGKFMITSHTADRTQDGGAGVWALSVKAIETMFTYAGFEVVERLPIPRQKGKRVPWYGAVCRAV